jgi:DNA polymerase III delta prime subunit
MDEKDRLSELDELAGDLLENLGTVATAAAEAPVRAWRTDQVLANAPGKISDSAARDAGHRLDAVRRSTQEAAHKLRDEPFIGRAMAEDETGVRRLYYICRTTPPNGVELRDGGNLVSYLGPFGRIAELAPGTIREIRVPRGRLELEILENIAVRPGRTSGAWDAEARVRHAERVQTVSSLRQLLDQRRHREAAAEDELAAMLREEEERQAVVDGQRRRVVEQLGLRDQPFLDEFQGEVFRLPLAKRLMLSGPPGTGKTTTLIRRLAQKRRFENLDVDEQENIPEALIDVLFSDDNWTMFTPTELLKLYLKEAFARWNVAASDERVRTWVLERHRLARNVLNVLKSGKGGRFFLDDSIALLKVSGSPALAGLAAAFGAFVERELATKYDNALQAMTGAVDADVRRVARQLSASVGDGDSLERLANVVEYDAALSELQSRYHKQTDLAVQKLVAELFAKDGTLLARVATVSASQDEEDDDDDDLDGERMQQKSGLSASLDVVKRALLRRAMAEIDGRPIRKASMTWRVLDAVNGGAIPVARLDALGCDSILLRHVRFLATFVRNAVDRVPAAFQRFRRQAQREGEWYREDSRAPITASKITGHEVDVVLVTMLRNARTLLEWNGGHFLYRDSRFASLESIKGELRTQILVDEATDFSVVQLACMEALAHPRFRSFFASGDVRQRVTSHGLQSVDELRWIDRKFDQREIEIGYRQTQRLTALAAAIAEVSGHAAPRVRTWEALLEEGAVPALCEGASGIQLVTWLADRIVQVEEALGQLPSIAVFVDGDHRIDPLADALRQRLANHNLSVAACKAGRVVGDENEIRVFDIQHIKGLEFEAVFFCGIDLLANREPDLFDKYLYVGVTRAAMYLGVCCDTVLPARLESIRSHFSNDGWATS